MDPQTKRLAGAPVPVFHAHGARLSLRNANNLLVKAFDGAVHISPTELFNDRLQLRIALSRDLVKVTVEAAEESDAFALGDTHVDCFLDERHFER